MALCSKCKTAEPLSYHRYCRECKNADSRAKRKPFAALSQEQKRRSNTRTRTRMLIARGKIKQRPCWCGKPAQRHHDDYDDPYSVEFLCREHHAQRHTARDILSVLIRNYVEELRRLEMSSIVARGTIEPARVNDETVKAARG